MDNVLDAYALDVKNSFKEILAWYGKHAQTIYNSLWFEENLISSAIRIIYQSYFKVFVLLVCVPICRNGGQNMWIWIGLNFTDH